jgi:3-hydroxyisobutyrate dehydrogenase-like beta-hydroxyacid dehydrogenase
MENGIGIIGLGIMGGAMARNLIAAGWQVFGFDTDATRLAIPGLTACSDAADVAGRTTLLLTSLPSVKAVMATAEAIAASGLPPRTVIEASTLALEDKLRFHDILSPAGHVPLDCPISGTGSQAITKDLVIYASGNAQAIEATRPAFAAFTRAVHDVGVFGNGTRMKLVANLLVAIHNVASAEAMVLGMKAGLDPQQVADLVMAGAGTSRVFELRAPMMVTQEYLPATMKVDIWQKDMDIIGHFATALGVPTPTFSATLPIYAAAQAQGHGSDDTAAVCAVLEGMAAVKR